MERGILLQTSLLMLMLTLLTDPAESQPQTKPQVKSVSRQTLTKRST